MSSPEQEAAYYFDEDEDKCTYYGAPEGVVYSRKSDWLPEGLQEEIDDWAPGEKDLTISDEEDVKRTANVDRLKGAFHSLFPKNRHFCNIHQLFQAVKRLGDLWELDVKRSGFSLSIIVNFAIPHEVSDTWSLNFSQVTGRNAKEWFPTVDEEQMTEPQAQPCVIPVKITALRVGDPPRPVSPPAAPFFDKKPDVITTETKNNKRQYSEDKREDKKEKEMSTPKKMFPDKKKRKKAKTPPKRDYSDLLFSKQFSDIRFVSREGKNIPAHRMILAGSSRKFEHELKVNTGSKWKVPYSTNVVKTVLKHIYCDSITEYNQHLHEEPLSFLSFACLFELEDLSHMAVKATIDELDVATLASALKMTEHYKFLEDVRMACFDYAKNNPVEVLSDPDMVQLGCDHPQLWRKIVEHIHTATDNGSFYTARTADEGYSMEGSVSSSQPLSNKRSSKSESAKKKKAGPKTTGEEEDECEEE